MLAEGAVLTEGAVLAEGAGLAEGVIVMGLSNEATLRSKVWPTPQFSTRITANFKF